MVARKLIKVAATPEIAAAVPGPHAGGALTLHQQSDNRATDHRVGAVGGDRQFLSEPAVKIMQAAAQADQALGQAAFGQFGQAVDDQSAGQGAVLVTAHAVGNYPESM